MDTEDNPITQEAEQVGRYQLCTGTVDFSFKPRGTTTPRNLLFKIDTATGQTWVYDADENRWLPVPL